MPSPCTATRAQEPHLLVTPEHIYVAASGLPEPNILRTCKAIRGEAEGIYYAEDTFVKST